MDIEGEYGNLSEEEKAVTGLSSPVLLSAIDTVDLLAKLDERTLHLAAMRGADDDELTHAERATIVPATFELASDRNTLETLVGQLLAHQVELSIKDL